MNAADYLDLSATLHAALFDGTDYPWQILPKIAPYLETNLIPGIEGEVSPAAHLGPAVRIGPGTIVEPGATIKGPAWIGANCQIRSGCYIRENVVVGDNAVLGNSCEFKNCLLFDGAQAPHFNYVGDSILGAKAHLGAGVILSNVRLDHLTIRVHAPNGPFDTGLRKFGALVGDRSEIGCNSVLSPGSIIGRDCVVYPTTHWRGHLPHRSVARLKPPIDIIPR